MGIINWVREQVRVNRAGRLKQNNSELKRLEAKAHRSDEDQKRINQLNKSIGKDEERQKIASEKAVRAQIINKNKTINKQTTNNVDANVNYKGTQTVGDTTQTTTQKMESSKTKPQQPKKSK